MKNIISTVLKRGFSWLGQNLTKMVREAGKLKVWGTVVSIFKMDQNWN